MTGRSGNTFLYEQVDQTDSAYAHKCVVLLHYKPKMGPKQKAAVLTLILSNESVSYMTIL